MFVSLREITTARGRFALIGGVVALITLLLAMLTGLTEGLGKQNTSALEQLGERYPQVSFSTEEPSFVDSAFTSSDVSSGEIPLAAGQTRVGEAGAVAVLGLPAGTAIPGTSARIPERGVLASESLELGDEVEVAGTLPDAYYSHSLVVWAATNTWRELNLAPQDFVGQALLHTEDAPGAMPMNKAFAGLPAYQSERGSLLTMQAFLYGISALVTVAFLSVWTIQRTRDLSILAALGASVRYLLRDALSQAALILAAGVIVGAVGAWAIGAAVSGVVPFELSPLTIAGPALGIWGLGMLGALVATRRVAKTDPLAALN